ncbi:MAG: VOC family protein [Terrimonas sp.]|nr:VOC family protein [Terrimonas sp.]OJY82574.1 MAG: VOC family protein [Sphingobacteriales bacterium 40-81]
MKAIHAYLTFNGNCRAAMKFYQKCLGGELLLQLAGESPLSDRMPAKMKKLIVHSVLNGKNFCLTGTDMATDDGLQKGNAVALLINCSSERELRIVYKNLSAGGKQTQPARRTHWGALFATLTDKYGNHWLLNYKK